MYSRTFGLVCVHFFDFVGMCVCVFDGVFWVVYM